MTTQGFVPVSWIFAMIERRARKVMLWADGNQHRFAPTSKSWMWCDTQHCTTVSFDPDRQTVRGRCGNCGQRGRTHLAREMRRRVFR